jgi:hypothetical protein
MRLRELFSEDSDPIGDLIRAKEAGFSPDPLDQLVDKFVAAEPKPVAKQSVASSPLPAVPAPAAQSKQPVPPTAQPAPARQAPAPVIPQAPGSVAWQSVRDYLSSKGLTSAQIIGMLANIQHESGFRPNVQVTDSNGLPSGGLFQHNGPRFQTLVNKLGKSWSTNWKGQIDFALSEPDGQRYVSNKFTDPHQASKWWTINFERPAKAKATAQTRAKTAGQFQRTHK